MALAGEFFTKLTGVSPRERGVGGAEPRNALIHLASLGLTKVADGVIQPKLVLVWLLGALGAPASVVGAVVPVREAGALLPQLVLASHVSRAAVRKRVWALGSAMQGMAALGIAGSALALDGAAAWAGVLLCLTLLAVSRSLCSLSHKDALARTIGKTRRGAVTGAAGTASATVVVGFAAGLAVGVIPLTPLAISMAVALAGVLWLLGAGLFLCLDEPAEPGGDAARPGWRDLFRPLRDDAQLRRFVAARGLLVATALAPPFIVMLSSAGTESRLGDLGPLMLAASAASILSAYVWGRLSDRSSRKTLMAAGALAAATLAGCAAVGAATGSLGGLGGSVVAMFLAQIAYEGVRASRKLHLTDMAGDDTRARYTALSNTAVGVLLVLGGGFGAVADLAGVPAVLAAFALMSAASVAVSAGLREVQHDD